MSSRSILDLMKPEDRERAIERGKARLERKKANKSLSISPELYEVAEFGYYFGWDAVLAVRRGYTVSPVSGEKELLSMDEVQVLLEGARKVWYSKLIEQSSTNMHSITSAFSQTPGQSLENQLKPVQEKASVTE